MLNGLLGTCISEAGIQILSNFNFISHGCLEYYRKFWMSLHQTLGLWAQGLRAAGGPGLCLTCHFCLGGRPLRELDDSDFGRKAMSEAGQVSRQKADQLIAGQSAG